MKRVLNWLDSRPFSEAKVLGPRPCASLVENPDVVATALQVDKSLPFLSFLYSLRPVEGSKVVVYLLNLSVLLCSLTGSIVHGRKERFTR